MCISGGHSWSLTSVYYIQQYNFSNPNKWLHSGTNSKVLQAERHRNIFKTVTENLDACKLYNILLIKQEYKCINKNVWCSLHKSAYFEDVNASEFFLQHTFHTTKLGCQKDQFFLVFQSKTLKPNEHACMNIIYIIICLYEQGIMFHITNIMYNVYLQ